jgi:hypothetical protein
MAELIDAAAADDEEAHFQICVSKSKGRLDRFC